MTLGVVFCFLASFTFYFFTLLMIYSLYTQICLFHNLNTVNSMSCLRQSIRYDLGSKCALKNIRQDGSVLRCCS